MRVLHCVLILAFAFLLKYFYWDSSNPLPNSPLKYLSSLQRAPPQIKPVPTEFTIHGLWPQPNGAPSTEQFDANKIATLTSKLNNNWPNLESKQQQVVFNIDFWKAEWNRSMENILAWELGSSNKQQIQEIRVRYTNNFQKQNNLSPSNCGPEILFPAPGFGLTEVVSVPEVHHHHL
ncbi:ribonuclease 2-like protein [Tanacetum coccineum]